MLVISEQLKKYRTQRGMTQEELAEQLFISRQAISKWEKGEANPDLEHVVKLSTIFDVSLDELVLAKEKINDSTPDFDHFIYNPNTGDYEKQRSKKITNFYEFAARFWSLLMIVLYIIYAFTSLLLTHFRYK